MSELLKLAERCEKAGGPDRVLDAEIYIAVRDNLPQMAALTVSGDVSDHVPKVTASLDAALTLVPEGWSKFFTQFPGLPAEASTFECRADSKGKFWHGTDMADSGRVKAATPALALCAAALRARASMEADCA